MFDVVYAHHLYISLFSVVVFFTFFQVFIGDSNLCYFWQKISNILFACGLDYVKDEYETSLASLK